MGVALSHHIVAEREGMSRHHDIEKYRRALAGMVKEGEVRCPKCDNEENFMVNEIGHVFCNLCYAKIPMMNLNEKI